MAKNPVVWWEIASPDAIKTAEFCRKVFDWELNYDEQTTIYEFPEPPGENKFAGGGIFTPKPGGVEPHTTIYIAVDSVDEIARAAVEAGGSIMVAPTEIVPGTRICLVKDPVGVILAGFEKL